MLDTSLVHSILTESFPSLEVAEIVALGEGWHIDAFAVNEEYVFRFPKTEEAVVHLRKEICMLPKLRSALPLAIPDFTFVGKPSQSFPRPFVGYKMIDGEILTKESFASLSDAAKKSIAKQVADFVMAMHSFPSPEAKKCGIETLDARDDYTEFLREIREKALPKLSGAEQEEVVCLFEWFLEEEKNFAYEPILRHADLGLCHLLSDGQKLIGVIDFGDMTIGDPEYELHFLYEGCGRVFIELILQYLNHPDPDRLLQKLQFYSKMNFLDDALHGPTDGWKEWGWKEFRRALESPTE